MTNRIVNLTVLVAFPLFIPCRVQAAELRVPADYAGIQAAIDAAADGDIVIVSPGRYVENIDFLRKGITLQSSDPDDAAIVAATIIDGGQIGPCVTMHNVRQCALRGFTITNGTAGAFGGGIYCNRTTVLIAGNRIVNNHATYWGGGVAVFDSESVIMTDNTVSGNSAQDMGGGIILSNCRNILFEKNSINSNSSYLGAGMFVESTGVIAGNTISENVGVDHAQYSASGAGIFLSGAIGLVADNVLFGNSASVGGAICALPAIDLTVARNVICGTIGNGTLPCVYIGDGSDVAIAYNTLVGNRKSGVQTQFMRTSAVVGNTIAENSGTGVIVGWDSLSVTSVVGNLIAGNGGGVLCDQGISTLVNNTIIGNRAAGSGGGIRAYRSQVLVANTILRDNSAPARPELHVVGEEPIWYQASLTVKSSNVAGGEAGVIVGDFATLTWGSGNIDADPLFVDPGHWDDAGTPSDPSDDTFILGDYHLLPGSPCIDAGTNDVDNPGTPEVETLPSTDIAGLPRVIDGDLDGAATVDIGVYEYLPGDVNYDGRVNVLDLILVRNSLGGDPASSIQARKADVNADGAVNVLDLLVVRGRLGR